MRREEPPCGEGDGAPAEARREDRAAAPEAYVAAPPLPARVARRPKQVALLAIAVFAVSMVAAAPSPSSGFEAFEGRLQAHGFFESQMRAISADYAEDWDMTQWYQVFNLELEVDILTEPLGPLDLLQGFVRAEVRYDCVYTRACGTARSVNVYGDRAKSLPRRLSNAHSADAAGSIPVIPDGPRLSGGTTDPVPLDQVAGFYKAYEQRGADKRVNAIKTSWTKTPFITGIGDVDVTIQSRFDDPTRYLFENFDDFRFTQIQAIGGGQSGLPVQILGPWLPKNFIVANAGLADRVNPFDDSRQSEVVKANTFNSAFSDSFTANAQGRPTFGRPERARQMAAAATGNGALPYRAIPPQNEGKFGVANGRARGLYIPSPPMTDLTRSGDLDDFTKFLNFRQAEREWNRGASQQDEKELKEAYLDAELFDSRLWIRVGKQSIVWGKTELFRTTDQFNPQDLALASLPSLEESRIALWAVRGVYSFYEVGPFQDVRLELAFNFDDFESNDLGACGEAYTVNLVCQAAFGAFAHGLTGIGLAGARLPDDPWQSTEGWEGGARLEWRWDRFSFAISDFYGYNDLPYVTRLTTYERNVDPVSGRPRTFGSRGPCRKGTEDSCLTPGPTQSRTKSSDLSSTKNIMGPALQQKPRDEFTTDPDAFGNVPKVAFKDPNNALSHHPGNLQLFAMVCSTTLGVATIDGSACAQNIFGSTKIAIPFGGAAFTVGQAANAILAGAPEAASLLAVQLGIDLSPFLVQLNADPGDLKNPDTVHLIRDANGKRIRFKSECLDFNVNPTGTPCGGYDPSDPNAVNSSVFALAGVTLSQRLTPYQEAALGCGPFFGTNCDDSGIDFLNADFSVLLQSMPGFEGTRNGWRTDNPLLVQPGTMGFDGGPVCLSNYLFRDGQGKRQSGTVRLPGCRGPGDAGYNPLKDGCIGPTPGHPECNGATLLVQPILQTKHGVQQVFQNELAALSWNLALVSVTNDEEFKKSIRRAGRKAEQDAIDAGLPPAQVQIAVAAAKFTEAQKPGQCSFVTPQFCGYVQDLFLLGGITRPDVKATGSGRFGRRAFGWHSGGELVIDFEKRNVLGFSSDFAVDSLKSNFSFEFTWIPDVYRGNTESWDGLIDVDEYNLTISADRPTFINFLNANRTFFFNTQWFFQYVDGWKVGTSGNGPWNVLMTFAVSTGYFQDRLLPTLAFVYDVQSNSGAALPQITYRYNEAFSITVGANVFMGRAELGDMPVNPPALTNRVTNDSKNTFKDQEENGLAVFRDRDEVFLRLRYSF